MSVISFGHDCSMSYYISVTTKIRYFYYCHLFDNMVTKNIRKLADLLLTNGEDMFLDTHILDSNSQKNMLCVKCNKYDIYSVHDASVELSDENAILLIRDKKIPEFQKLAQYLSDSNEHLFLLRSNTKDTKLEDTVYFHEVITKIRKDKPFTLFLLQTSEDGMILNSLPNTKYYPIKTLAEWKVDMDSWLYDPNWRLAFRDIYSTINGTPLQML